MTEPDTWKQKLLEPRIAEQVDYICRQYREVANTEIGVVVEDRGVGYMYAEGQILVRYDYLEAVRRVLEEDFETGESQPLVPGVVVLPVQQRRTEDPLPAPEDLIIPSPIRERAPAVPQALELIDRVLGEGVATPNHVLTVAPVMGPCPATEPEPVYDGTEPNPGICTRDSGRGVLIYIADTGLLEDAEATHSWLHGVRRAHHANGTIQDWDPLGPYVGTTGLREIYPYTGHGTFVAGVARCQATEAEVIVSNIFKVAGSALETNFVKDLAAALKLGVDIFHLSITAPTRKDLYLLGFQGWLDLLRHYQGTVCVVAAGNNGSREPSWPAAFPGMVSVGALGADWRNRAKFSNHGGWVDVYAPGRDLVNAFATGLYTCYVQPYIGEERKFYGMARWSGTSFSTPMVTGLVAARMSRTGENGREAADALLAQARAQAIPGVGAVLLPCGDREHRCPPERPGCGCERRSCGC